jgi:CheY-like chemotaxis protein
MAGKKTDKPTIIVAEDDKDDQEILAMAFKRITDKHHLKLVDNGKDLVELLGALSDHELPCLIVLDYNMPHLNGKETLKLLRSKKRYDHIPKIIFTTSNSGREKADCISIGARDFMIKPTDIEDIVGSARKMLGYCDNNIN